MKRIDIAGRQFYWEDCGAALSGIDGKEAEGRLNLRLHLVFPGKTGKEKGILKFSMPALRTDGVWSACGGLNRWLTPDWGPVVLPVRSVCEYPVVSVVSFDDRNVLTVSCADTRCTLRAGYREEKSELVFEAVWEAEIPGAEESFYTELFLDFREIHFSGCVRSAADLLRGKYGLTPAPAAAFAPVFSTWYCFHQELNREKLLDECRAAKSLGLETVILDDGWETEDTGRGFGYTGDYLPAEKKVGNIRTLTAELRELGLKSMIWFSLAFAGDFSQSTEKYKGMSLYHDDVQHAYVVDPRFPEVRAHIVGYCTKAVRDWGFDGLKLDFIDSFRTDNKELRDGMDCGSLEEGIKRLTDSLKTALRAIRDDVLIEFRQRYVGPVMQRLGNMFRVGDCPGSLLQNRVSSIDLRLIAGENAVHSDPLEWNEGESPETIATYFIHTIFSVLQYSVFPSGLTDAQRAVSANYIRFMKEYEDILLHGTLEPSGVLYNYLSCKAANDRGSVVALYAPVSTTLRERLVVLLNGSLTDGIVVDPDGKEYRYSIVDCFGNIVSEGRVCALAKLIVPIGGRVLFEQKREKENSRQFLRR